MLAGEGDEEAARLGLPAVEHGRRGHRHGAVALGRPADDRGDLAEAERDHAQAARRPASGSRLTRQRLTEAGSLEVTLPFKAARCCQHVCGFRYAGDMLPAGSTESIRVLIVEDEPSAHRAAPSS